MTQWNQGCPAPGQLWCRRFGPLYFAMWVRGDNFNKLANSCYIWGARWKMGWVWIFSAYKTDTMFLPFLLMLRSSCIQGEKQLPRLPPGQSWPSSQAQLCEEQSTLPWTKHSVEVLYQKRGIRVQYVLSVTLPFWHKCQGHTVKSHVLDIGTPAQQRDQEEKCVWFITWTLIVSWNGDVKNRLDQLDQGNKFVPITWTLQQKQTMHSWIYGVCLLPCHWRAELPHHDASLRWSPCSSSVVLLCMTFHGAGLQHHGASLETRCRSSCQSAWNLAHQKWQYVEMNFLYRHLEINNRKKKSCRHLLLNVTILINFYDFFTTVVGMGNQLIGKERKVMNCKYYSKSLKRNFDKYLLSCGCFLQCLCLGAISITEDLDKFVENPFA